MVLLFGDNGIGMLLGAFWDFQWGGSEDASDYR